VQKLEITRKELENEWQQLAHKGRSKRERETEREGETERKRERERERESKAFLGKFPRG
jgi:hypothetical protein